MDNYGVADTVQYSPLEVSSLADKCIVDIKCGYNHVLVLTDDGKVKLRYSIDNCDYYELYSFLI
jgi:alpha-tubulin suppressor-like RCC1 family protein